MRRRLVILASALAVLAATTIVAARAHAPQAPPAPLAVPAVPAAPAAPVVVADRAPAPAPAPASASAAATGLAAMAADTRIPEDLRRQRLEAAAASGSADALQELIGIARSDLYLAPDAIGVLGGMDAPAAADCVRDLCRHRDAKHVAAALRALARRGGPAVPVIADTLAANRTRPDGQEDIIGTAGVEALAATGSPAAIPVLARELAEAAGRTLPHDHGLLIAGALATLGQRAGVPVLDGYRQRLEGERAIATDPQAIRYFDDLIASITATARSLGQPHPETDL